MAPTSGTDLGPYEILSAIGAGRMGEVYRARDPKAGRDVAIKVLPETFARYPERVARFQREAKVGRWLCVENRDTGGVFGSGTLWKRLLAPQPGTSGGIAPCWMRNQNPIVDRQAN